MRTQWRFFLSVIVGTGLGMLAGCQAPGMEMPPGDERGPEQMGLKIDFNPGFAARGVLASVPTHFGRAYADEGLLEFRVATVRNESGEEVEFFPILSAGSDSPRVELRLRMWTAIPRHVREVSMNENRTLPESPVEDYLVDYHASFSVMEAKVVFGSGGSVPFPEGWGKILNPRGILIRAGESAEVRWVLRLRPSSPLLAGTPVPLESVGVARPGVGFLAAETASLPAANMRVETLIAHSIRVATGQSFAARQLGEEEIHPLFVDSRFRKPYFWDEDRVARSFDAYKNGDLWGKSARYQIPGLPILL